MDAGMTQMGHMPLRMARDRWIDAADEVEAIETQWLRELTVINSVKILLDLYEGFHDQLEETEALYRPAKQTYLEELGRRMRRLAEWQQKHGQPTA
jgi:hypothetical protein